MSKIEDSHGPVPFPRRSGAGAENSRARKTWWVRFLLTLCLALTLAACATYAGYDYYYPYDTHYYPYDYTYPYYYSPYYYYPQGYYYKPYVIPEKRHDRHKGGSGHFEGGKGGDGSGHRVGSPTTTPGGGRSGGGSGRGGNGRGGHR